MSEFQLRSVRQETQARLNFAATAKEELAQIVATAQEPIGDPIADLFGDVIHCYTRRQAIEDGVLVQLSGEGYVGDQWVPKMVAEAGFRFPIAMTSTCFNQIVAVTPAAKRACQDIEGRLWDVLWMLKNAVARHRGDPALIIFELRVSIDSVRPRLTQLKAVCGPGDQGEPVITIMFTNED